MGFDLVFSWSVDSPFKSSRRQWQRSPQHHWWRTLRICVVLDPKYPPWCDSLPFSSWNLFGDSQLDYFILFFGISCSAPSHFLAMITPRWGSTCTWKSEQGGVWWVLKVESSISILCSASNLNSSGWTPPAAPSCRSLSMTYWILVASHDDTMQ